jgi:hypothetical protein
VTRFGPSIVVPLAVIAGAFAFAEPSQASGLFDFLFGGFQNREPNSPSVQSYAEPSAPGPIAPVPLAGETVRQGMGGTGRGGTYCVRLCDGQHFPMAHLANATPVETCRAMCPASKTKVFFGSEIGGAVARDGARYADLDNAFLYRKQIVANCTCNGRDAFGLMPFDVANDPTLRPGDIVATKDGLMAYSGKTATGPAFTRVEPSSVAAQLNAVTKPARLAKRNEPVPDDDPGTITPAQRGPSPVALEGAPRD